MDWEEVKTGLCRNAHEIYIPLVLTTENTEFTEDYSGCFSFSVFSVNSCG
ncbi:MAG: hypothetical protein PWR29_908 [Methanolobus sp.]|jgi:hypothetical protein|nr:hypothetical protein [Methanolobus sp.]